MSGPVVVRAQGFQEAFQQAIQGGGLQSVILCKLDGSLISYTATSEREAQIPAAIAANVWTSALSQKESIGAEDPEYMLVDAESGRLFVQPAADLLLCLVAQQNVGFGMLRLKAGALLACIASPLRDLAIK
eukprot:m.24205 g.24205  ORF g.24205 m.24205 type:complete len:131 (+) comp8646_c1_seq1:20-412(+)